MTLEAFLQRHATSLDQLIDGARTVVPLGADDRLIAVGSLAEGLGNGKSDVDLLYLTPDSRHAHASPEEVRSFAAGRCVVDLRIIPTGYASALRSRLRSWAEGEWSLNVAADFTPGDVLLLHRLRAGITLWPDSIGPESALDRDVARLKLHVARHMARTLQVDMAGYRGRRRPVSGLCGSGPARARGRWPACRVRLHQPDGKMAQSIARSVAA